MGKWNRDLMQMQRERHDHHNKVTATMCTALESVAESNRMMMENQTRWGSVESSVIKLTHWTFGVDGANGANKALKKVETLDGNMKMAIGGGIILNLVIMIAVAWLTR